MGLGFEKIANLEINLLYRLARAMDIILRDCEKNLELQLYSFHKEKKKTFNELMRSIENSKRLYDKLDEDVCNIYQDGRDFDQVQEEAFELAEMLVNFADKHPRNPKLGRTINKMLNTLESSGNIPYEGYLENNFKLK